MRRWRTFWTSAAVAAAAVAAGMAGASAQSDVEAFYRGRAVTIVVAVGPGGPFGLRAQVLSQFLGRHTPGNPTVVVQYMPGAGGRVAANYLYNAAPKDGSVIGLLFYNTALSYRLRPQGAAFDPAKFNWLGSHSPTYAVAFAWAGAPATTLDRMKNTEVFFGASGRTSPTGMFPAVMNKLLKTRIRIVEGYQGTADTIKAAESREIHGAISEWDTLASAYGDRVRDGQIVPILQFGFKKHPELASVPLLQEVTTTPEARRIAEFIGAACEIGHTNVAPPGVPTERLAALRAGIAATYRDPAALAAAEKMKIPIQPVSAEEVTRMVESAMAAPADIVAKTRTAAGLD
jgi:tripartite-type tricarboxylate transporter receptor subunit TctC